MSDDELRRLFDTVLTASRPDTTDIDAAIRSGRRRTVAMLLSSAAVIAVVGITAAALLPGIQRQPKSPAGSPPATSTPVTANEGIPVTVARVLLGSWWAVELDGQNVRAVRDGGDRPLGVTFEQYGTQLRWGANDIINYHSGTFSVSKEGRFVANQGTVTSVGTTGKEPLYLQNPQAVEQATEARLVAATPADPPKLLLLTGGKIIAVYTPAAPRAAASAGHN
jgi:hypothetical protein